MKPSPSAPLRSALADDSWRKFFIGSLFEQLPGDHAQHPAAVHLVPAYHWSAGSLSDRRMALWSGFMINSAAGLVYFAGDTGYGSGEIFRAKHTPFGPPDLALTLLTLLTLLAPMSRAGSWPRSM